MQPEASEVPGDDCEGLGYKGVAQVERPAMVPDEQGPGDQNRADGERPAGRPGEHHHHNHRGDNTTCVRVDSTIREYMLQ
jgi:hypothetical protein